MEKAVAIQYIYPNAVQFVDFTVQNDGDSRGEYIAMWNLPDPMPTDDDLNNAYFGYQKDSKVEELKVQCQATIYAGFSANTTGHFYTMDDQDQANMTQKMLLIVHDTGNTITSFNVKTKDAGVVMHTRGDFLNVCLEAGNFKESNMERCWGLVNQVMYSANVASDLDNINW